VAHSMPLNSHHLVTLLPLSQPVRHAVRFAIPNYPGLASIKWTPIQAALMSFSSCLFSKATGEI